MWCYNIVALPCMVESLAEMARGSMQPGSLSQCRLVREGAVQGKSRVGRVTPGPIQVWEGEELGDNIMCQDPLPSPVIHQQKSWPRTKESHWRPGGLQRGKLKLGVFLHLLTCLVSPYHSIQGRLHVEFFMPWPVKGIGLCHKKMFSSKNWKRLVNGDKTKQKPKWVDGARMPSTQSDIVCS